jgi:hypothetical protein
MRGARCNGHARPGVTNDPLAISVVVVEAAPEPEVAIEATYGWQSVVDLLQGNGARV